MQEFYMLNMHWLFKMTSKLSAQNIAWERILPVTMKNKTFSRHVFFSSSSSPINVTPKVCIVGAGPAGFYAAMQLIKVILV